MFKPVCLSMVEVEMSSCRIWKLESNAETFNWRDMRLSKFVMFSLKYKMDADRQQGMCDIAADRARKLGIVDLTLWKSANRVSQLAESTPG